VKFELFLLHPTVPLLRFLPHTAHLLLRVTVQPLLPPEKSGQCGTSLGVFCVMIKMMFSKEEFCETFAN
jgi:hypothetical protein